MDKRTVILAILFISSLTFAGAGHKANIFAAEANKKNTDKSFEEYLKLRLDYSQSKEYNPYNSKAIDIKEECSKLIENGEFKKAIAKAEEGLRLDKYNIQFLVDLAIAYRELGDIENADKYRNLWTGCMDSILKPGDGKSANAAFKVINVAEEYAVLDVLKLQHMEQKLVTIGDSDFDVFRVKDPKTGEEFELYFNVDIPFGWLTKHISENK